MSRFDLPLCNRGSFRRATGTLAILAMCLAQTAYAGGDLNVCVSDAAGLQAALTATIANGASNDTILIRTGTYVAASSPFGSGGFYPSGDSITVSGGWSGPPESPCQTQSNDPTLTVIDGNDVRGGLQLSHQAGPGSMTVRNLTFENGHRQYNPMTFDNDRGGGLLVHGAAGNLASVLVERCIFRDNYASFLGGGLLASSDGGSVTVRNNLFVGNSASEGAALHVFGNSSVVYVANNTAADNSSPSAGKSNAAFAIGGSSAITLTNNIFWHNTSGTQTDLFGPPLLLVSNDIEKISGSPGAGSSSNLSVDPKFVNANVFRLSSGSPLINIGVNAPLGGLTTLDLDGQARIHSGTVDLGAYEFSFLFRDGFE